MIKKEAKNHPFRGKEKILLLEILKKEEDIQTTER